ncbi:MAG: hypothetical protein ACNA8W_22075 [Bradymonadaceae bacterium]
MQLSKLGGRLSGVVLVGTATMGLLVACNEHPVTFVRATGAIEIIHPEQRGTAEELDILWMIDNSGSMCQEQGILREGFESFIEILADIDLDFHIAVTTTHMVTHEQYPFETVALPGYLQSTPQPVPGFDSTCYYELNPDGTLDTSSMAPVLENIRIAVECTSDPSQYSHLLNPNQRALQCALDAARWGCDSAETDDNSPEDYFPPRTAFREIPKVLRAEDYRDANRALNIDRLRADFNCMSMVGTRGYGFEKGLLSVVTALSPELTAEGGPNEGFLRPSARTGIIFVSDENDCSHNGELRENSACIVAECTFSENEGKYLIPVDTLKASMMSNLAASKGVASVDEENVIVASIHGRYQRHTEPRPATCEETNNKIATSCASVLGQAYSGHRYDAFVRQFETFFPRPTGNDPNAALPGLICDDFTPALVDIANLFRTEVGGCINDVYRCAGPGEYCPSDPYSGAPGACTAYPNDGERFYCDSGIQVRLKYAGADAVTRLENTGYCIPESIDQAEFPRGCVVDSSKYRFIGCPGGSGLKLDWIEPQSHIVLGGFTIQSRYAILPDDE